MVSQENQSIVASVPADSLEVADPVDKKVSLDGQSAQDPLVKGQNEEKSAQKSVNPLDKGQMKKIQHKSSSPRLLYHSLWAS